jgi:hypothetical protein
LKAAKRSTKRGQPSRRARSSRGWIDPGRLNVRDSLLPVGSAGRGRSVARLRTGSGAARQRVGNAVVADGTSFPIDIILFEILRLLGTVKVNPS